jgi:hypothetical protein
MAVVQIKEFGGVVPRVPPRMLAAGAAQTNHNLLATATEFRPLLDDTGVGSAPAGALTLYRLSRNSDGSLRNDDTTGWITDLADKNFAKGQINDDATERTVVSFNDGMQAPRVIDATGADRLLGVPAPAKVTATLNEVGQFTQSDALTWVSSDVIPALVAALSAALFEDDILSRFRNNQAVAGPTAMPVPMEFYKPVPWMASVEIANAWADFLGLRDVPDANVVSSDPPDDVNWTKVLIEMFPYWGVVDDIEQLRAGIRAIESPKDGSAVFTETQVVTIADALAALFDPNDASLRAWRQNMDDIARQFVGLLNAPSSPPSVGATAVPPEPMRPTVNEWTTDASGNPVRAAEWTAYDDAMRKWRADLTDWYAADNIMLTTGTALQARLTDLRSQAVTQSNQIEAEYFRRKGDIETMVTDLVNGQNLAGQIEVDPDRIIDTRFYIATYVTDWGEESAPSPVSEMVEPDQNDSVTITVLAPPAGRNIQKWRLYRSNTGTQTAVFQFVDEFLISTPTYEDTLTGAQLGEPCPTLTWAEPPYRLDSGSASPTQPKGNDPYLRGVVPMPNGILAGFIDNFVAFCDPYHPYAWPVEYQITTDTPIVGLGVFGQSLFVGTLGSPYIISGADSASMTAEKVPSDQACVSRRSIVGVGDGVVYASPDGLCLASASGVQLLTGDLFAREDWQKLQPDKIVAGFHEGVYYFWTPIGCYALDFIANKLGTVQVGATAVHHDILTDHLFVVDGTQIKKLFNAGRRTGKWHSGTMVFEAQAPLAWLQLDGDQTSSAPVTVRWYADGALRYQTSITDIEPRRLPPGRWLEHEVEVESSARLTKLVMSTSTAELKAMG